MREMTIKQMYVAFRVLGFTLLLHSPLIAAKGLTPDEKRNIEVFQETSPSVVFINTKVLRSSIFSFDVTEIPKGSGTGFVWDTKGHIVTNFHVISGASEVRITFNNQESAKAKVVGVSPSKDIAVLKVPSSLKAKPLKKGASSSLIVGQKVYAVGNPFGLDQTLTVGVVSALGRQIKSLDDRRIDGVIQTDAAINPGNSGGPLLNSSSEVIGVNTQIYSPTGASAGIGFAVPIDEVVRIVPQLIKYGRVIRPTIGVQLLPDSIAKANEIDGAVIRSVVTGSGAGISGLKGLWRDRSGAIRLGDVITAIDGKKVEGVDDLQNIIERKKPGQSVRVSLIREGKKMTKSVKLGLDR